jgi:hypothetical protein
MRKLQMPDLRGQASTQSRAVSVTGQRAAVTSYSSTNLPPIRNQLTDIDIPNKLWSSWIPSQGDRVIRRELTADERAALERRAAELVPAVEPFLPAEGDRVVVALASMFGGYPSLRMTDEDAVGRLDSAKRMLEPYPAWAIETACQAIQENGVYRGGKYDRQWSPSDPEIIAAVREKVRFFKKQHDNVTGLLTAKVEDR